MRAKLEVGMLVKTINGTYERIVEIEDRESGKLVEQVYQTPLSMVDIYTKDSSGMINRWGDYQVQPCKTTTIAH